MSHSAKATWDTTLLRIALSHNVLAPRSSLCERSGGPGGNRTRASAMRMPRNTTLLQARHTELSSRRLVRNLRLRAVRAPADFFNLDSRILASACDWYAS